MDALHDGRVKLPGFGLPVNTLPDDHIPITYRDWKQNWPHTNRERCMLAFMEEITLEKDWPTKVFDNTEVATLKAELLLRDWERSSKIPHGDFTEAMFRYCINELRKKAKLYQETGIVPVLDIEACLGRSDRAISQNLCQALQKATKILESTGPYTQNSSPGTIDAAVNIIDPDKYALSYGRSKVLPDKEMSLQNCIEHSGIGELVPEPPGSDRIGRSDDSDLLPMIYALKSQWLPCNVEFPDGNNAKITSYIGNLHPRDHADVYSLLEKVITQAMPLWSLVYRSIYESNYPFPMRIHCSEALRKYLSTPPYDPLGLRDDLYSGLIDDDEWQRRTDEWLYAQKVIDRPEPTLYTNLKGRYDDWKSRWRRSSETIADQDASLSDLSKDKIQVIVKLSALYPTPETPLCNTETDWTLDGVPNEHICATAVFVFDDDNVTDTKISFRSRFDGLNFEEECQVEPGDFRAVEEIFGFTHRDASVQEIGSVTIREGLMVAYPNILQHLWSPTELKDPTKPGHRKILTLYLVDPRVKTLSTANVPPQQADWWAREFSTEAGHFKGLPKEIVNMVLDEIVGCPYSVKEAIRLKDEAIRERKRVSKQITRVLTSYRVDLGGNSDFEDSDGVPDNESVDFVDDI